MAGGLALAGFALVVMAYAACTLQFWRSSLNLQPRPHEAAPWVLALALVATIGWGAAGLADVLSSQVTAWHLALLFDHVRYGAWLGFMLLVLRGRSAGPTPLRGRVAAAGAAALFGAGLAVNLALALGWGGSVASLRALAFVQLAWAVSGLVLVEQLFRNVDESSKWSVKPLCLSLACLFAYDLYLYSQAAMFGFDADVVAARAVVHAGVVPLLWVASRRSAPSLERLRVSKDVAFYSAALLLAGAYMLVVAAAGYYVRYFGGTWGGALQVALMAVALLLLATVLFSRAQRARVKVLLGKHFFRYHYDYRVEWLRFTSLLSVPAAQPQDFGVQIVRGLADLVESPGGGLWLAGPGASGFVQTHAWNMPRLAAVEPADSAFCRQMGGQEWIMDFSVAPARGGTAGETTARPAWLAEVEAAWLAVPLMVGSELRGFVVLMTPRTPIELNWEVRDLLKTAARQAAGFLALMQATEALLEARKFDAFNRMSAFVVHDLKNIVTQLSLMLKNAERHRANPEFQEDMLMTVANSLEKMKQLMLQLREGERPEGVTSGVELAPLLQRLQQTAARRGREVALELEERLATRGHEQRLERVIGHVVQNALDATPADGRIWVRLERAGGRAAVIVGDTGAGMNTEFIRTRLFKPFNSTKAHGMGIGLYESAQYLKDMGGDVKVASEEGRGTVVTLTMPLFDSVARSELVAAQGV